MIIENKNLKITSEDIERCTDAQQIKEWIIGIEGDIVAIDAQIRQAKSKAFFEDTYADPNWFQSLVSAKKFQGALKQRCQTRLSALKSRKKPFSDFIVDAVKIRFDKQTWDDIVSDARILEDRYRLKNI